MIILASNINSVKRQDNYRIMNWKENGRKRLYPGIFPEGLRKMYEGTKIVGLRAEM
jgi:hypothetical protein